MAARVYRGCRGTNICSHVTLTARTDPTGRADTLRYVAATGEPRPVRWDVPSPYNYAGAIDGMGTIAAPLLAAVSVTLAAIVLSSPRNFGWVTGSLVCLLVAAGAFMGTVECTSMARQFVVTPGVLLEWWADAAGDQARLHVLRLEQRYHRDQFKHWANLARWGYNIGILALLLGVAALLCAKHRNRAHGPIEDRRRLPCAGWARGRGHVDGPLQRTPDDRPIRSRVGLARYPREQLAIWAVPVGIPHSVQRPVSCPVAPRVSSGRTILGGFGCDVDMTAHPKEVLRGSCGFRAVCTTAFGFRLTEPLVFPSVHPQREPHLELGALWEFGPEGRVIGDAAAP